MYETDNVMNYLDDRVMYFTTSYNKSPAGYIQEFWNKVLRSSYPVFLQCFDVYTYLSYTMCMIRIVNDEYVPSGIFVWRTIVIHPPQHAFILKLSEIRNST